MPAAEEEAECTDCFIDCIRLPFRGFGRTAKGRKGMIRYHRILTDVSSVEAYLYLENWDEARNYAEQALKIAGITTLTKMCIRDSLNTDI